jgi:hypothetical protein
LGLYCGNLFALICLLTLKSIGVFLCELHFIAVFQRKSILFRRACDKEFRQIATQFARATLLESSWAVAYHYQLCQHGVYGAHALRCLANRWLAIIWKLWQTRQVYDESYHLKQRYQRHQPCH